MIVYRLASAKYCRDLSGKGAELIGGRWNSKGTAMLYTSSSRALCLAEVAVHLSLNNIPLDYCMVAIQLPDTQVKTLLPNELPSGWSAFPYINNTQKIGDSFIESHESLILQVPSAIVDGDMNYLINPVHQAFGEIKIVEVVPFRFDTRLFQ